MIDKELRITYQNLCYVISDIAYALTPHCMKEHTNCQNNNQVVFNSMLYSARNQIRSAFGRLKASWSILTSKTDLKLQIYPYLYLLVSCFTIFAKILNEKSISENYLRKRKVLRKAIYLNETCCNIGGYYSIVLQ